MKKFRIQPGFSVIWLQRAIETGLCSDFGVADEPLDFESIYLVDLESIENSLPSGSAKTTCSLIVIQLT